MSVLTGAFFFFLVDVSIFIITKYQSPCTDAGLGENELMTRIKEHPSQRRGDA